MLRNFKRYCSKLDRISSLSDDLLIDILCLLPTKDAIATSVLSKRWRHLCTWITNLEVYASPLSHCLKDSPRLKDSFINSVDCTLQARQSRNLTRFCLRLGDASSVYTNTYAVDMKPTHLRSWISFPLTRGVKELDLCIHVTEPGNLPPQVFSCKTVEVLKVNVNLELEFPIPFCLPSLKVFHLSSTVIPNTYFLSALLSSSPSLEELVVKDCAFRGDLTPISLANPCLKRLSMCICSTYSSIIRKYIPGEGFRQGYVPSDYNRSHVVLDTPNLQHLEYADNLAIQYSLGKLNVLSEAIISLYEPLDDDEETCFRSWLNLLESFTNVHRLSLFNRCPEALANLDPKGRLPVFRNLTQLQFHSSTLLPGNVLLEFLYSSPFLQELILPRTCSIKGGDDDGDDVPSCDEEDDRLVAELENVARGIPSCVTSHLKKIRIGHYCPFDWQNVMLKYFLKNALVLEELEVACEDGFVISTEKSVNTLPRGSVNCSIKVTLYDDRMFYSGMDLDYTW